MKKVRVQFDDVLKLVEFISVTKNFHADTDVETCCVVGELPESAIELAVNGYKAKLKEY